MSEEYCLLHGLLKLYRPDTGFDTCEKCENMSDINALRHAMLMVANVGLKVAPELVREWAYQLGKIAENI